VQERLEKLESDYEVELPKKYRKELNLDNLHLNGNKFMCGNKSFSGIWDLYNISESGNESCIYPNFIFVDMLEGKLRIPKGFFIIGTSSNGEIVMNLQDGPDHGKVYYWCQGLEQEEATMENTFYVAENFEEFLNGVGDYFYDDADIEYHEIISKYEEKEDMRLYRLIQKLSTERLSREYRNIE
ncbi:MAG: SMI1/KNR4 family protein, partial [Candidatus Gracilibacteria bacterium]|nr:SMI1/KNR4 family protein [Candidatus Gracilibacteria bacterium]